MSEYRRGTHTVFEIHPHLVWITKYRGPVITGDVGQRDRDLIREICGQEDVRITRAHISEDQVHIFVSLPHVTISRLLQRLKGKTVYKLFYEYPHLRKKVRGSIFGRETTSV